MTKGRRDDEGSRDLARLAFAAEAAEPAKGVAEGASQRGVVDGETLRPPEELEQPPLAPELVSPRRGVRGFCATGAALSTH